MLNRPRQVRVLSPVWVGLAGLAVWLATMASGVQGATNPAQGELVSRQGTVDFSHGVKDTNWVTAPLGQTVNFYERLRTAEQSRAAVRLIDLDVLQMNELTVLELLPPEKSTAKARLDLRLGKIYFLDRVKPREVEVQMQFGSAGIEGTEFHIEVAKNGRIALTVFDGRVTLTNSLGSVTLTNLDQGVIEPNQAPTRSPGIAAVNIIQWCLYYPGVLDPDELGLSVAEQVALADSLAAYRAGNLLRALQTYPAGRVAGSAAERIYHAGLLLSVGKVTVAESALAAASSAAPGARALRWLIAAVQFQSLGENLDPHTAGEWLAKSYYSQAFHQLRQARDEAREATRLSPNFGFALARVAELEFSHDQVPEAAAILDRALRASPENAQAHALAGFLWSARSRYDRAITSFETALQLDPALGNAWLGRGLCRIRLGQRRAGRQDLELAAALEPNRSVLRSYLGKAFSHDGDDALAAREIALAKNADLQDPTPWLYSALLSRELNRVNAAVRELEHSVELNDNRRLYRSRFQLDQDEAVRSAQLAAIYQSAGLEAVGLREAARAVNLDYANYTAHLFLADSFNALRDPKRVNLRYETAWFNERLLANLLAPVGAGTLSQHVSQQEYSRLFAQDGPGLSSSTEYLSSGDVREVASQFGTFGRLGYALDVEYQSVNGRYPNSGFERLEWYTQIKLQLTTQDSVFLLTEYQDFTSGDSLQYYDPSQARPNLKFSELQDPILLLAYHHEWRPGIQTLLLAGRLVDDVRLSNQGAQATILIKNQGQVVDFANPTNFFDLEYRNQTENYTAELNQIFENENQTLIVGGRYNSGQFLTSNQFTNLAPGFQGIFQSPSATPLATDLERRSIYGYYTLKPGLGLLLTVGAAYDHLRYPDNFRDLPVNADQTSRKKFSPKAALTWSVSPRATLRGVYTRSLGGVTFDESIRLEPTQLAGFNQAFRTLIAETEVGSVSGARYETWGAAFDWNLPSRTYLGLQGEVLREQVQRDIGVFDFSANPDGSLALRPSRTPQELEYEERSATVGVQQLCGEAWSFGASYRLTDSVLDTRLPAVPGAPVHQHSRLDQLSLQALFSDHRGWFTRTEAVWYDQRNTGYVPAIGGEDFWQCNLYAGYRWRHQRAEVTVGLLNVAGVDYRLSPLNPYLDLPRDRTFYARLKFNF